ncbi:hypothetical protein [Sulfuricurvum sp.]|uniref:hypothetical protein n=1 Tax=Sulfuricurvum sp. TaxID=2025608 RepID=UPI003BB0997E
MKFYCDKNIKTINHSCKKHLVVIERGVAKIFYLRFYTKKEMTYKEIIGNDKYLLPILDYYKDYKASEQDLKYIVQNVRDTHAVLKESNQEDKTLDTLSATYATSDTIRILFDHGILMEDDSIVYFHDLSAKMDGILHTLFKGGIL